MSGGSWGTGANWTGSAVPAGASLLAFTNTHAGTVSVTLDGNRAQTNSLLFANGDWSIQPGTPGTSTLNVNGGYNLTVSNGVTTLGAAGQVVGAGGITKRGAGELCIANARQFANNIPTVLEGVLRLAAGGSIKTGSAVDTVVDGTGTLIVDGGKLDTKIIRLGNSTVPNGARFRLASGTVSCGGSGGAVLLVGYTAAPLLSGYASAEILGGTFAATGLVDDAGIYIGTGHNGSLFVSGTNGVPATVNVGKIWFGWRDNGQNNATTNLFDIGSNAVIYAASAVSKGASAGLGRLYLHKGGTLRTPIVTAAAGAMDFHFDGGKLELTATTNATLFSGSGMIVSVDTDSELDIGTNAVLMASRFTGAAALAKTGTGTLLFGGDVSVFTGTLDVKAGGLAVSNLTGGAGMSVRLGAGTTLDLTAVSALVPNLSVVGNASVTAAEAGVTLSSLTLTDGTLTLPDNDYLTVLALSVPTGANVTLSSAGTVAIGSLTGGGTLTVAGGGTFNLIDDAAFMGGASAEAGTALNRTASAVSRLTVSGSQTLPTAGGKLTVNELTLAGGTLTVAGGGELALGSVTVYAGATAGIALADGAVVTNVASLALGAGSVFQPSVAAGAVFSVGSTTGTGTLLLDGGTVAIGALDTGLNFDIQSGKVAAHPLAGPDSVTYTSGEPAFWVDASEAASLSTVNGKLEWRDRRYNVSGPYDMKATATGTQPTVTASDPDLNNRSVVRFASPATTVTYKGMEWSRRLTEMRTIFWVIGAQEGGGGLIGDSSLIDFLRGEVPAGTGYDTPYGIYYAPLFSLKYANVNRDHLKNVQNGVTRINGQVTDAFRSGFPSPDYHVVSLLTASNTVGKAFASERFDTQYFIRSGCQRLAEALVFTNALTDAEIAATESYLQKKWFGTTVRANSVRIGSAGARFEAVGGKVIINELQVVTPNNSPTNNLAGVDRIERMVVSASGVVLGNASRTALPYDIGELRVEGGVAVTVDTASASSAWIGSVLSGTGTVAVTGGSLVEIGGVMTAAGDDLTLDCASVPLRARTWKSSGTLRVAGATGLKITAMDLSGTNTLAYAGSGPLLLSNDTIRASGVLNVVGNLSVVSSSFSMNPGSTLALNLDTGGRDVQVSQFVGNGAFVKTGTGTLTVGSQVTALGGVFTFAYDTFANSVLPRVILYGGGLNVTGAGLLAVSELRTDTQAPLSFTLAAGVTMTVSNLNHTIGTLTLPTSGTLSIVNLTPSSDAAVVLLANATTVVRTLATTTDGRVVLQGGTLQVLDSITNVKRFALLNAGLILPDGTLLTPTLFDVRSDARLDLGAGSVLTLNVAGQAFSNSVTFVQGAVVVGESLSLPGTLRLEGTALSVAAGKSLTAAALTGDGQVTVAAGGTLTIPNLNGYDGILDNQGGTLNVSNDRINPVPNGPVVSPTFWVDASQSGSLTTNAQNKLVWLDKRTVRDGTPGLMSATSSNMPTILQNELNGLPVVNFGPLGVSATDERGMTWSARLTDVRAVHWVIGAQNGGGQMLGDYKGGHIDYFRYSDVTTAPYTNNYGYGDYRTPLWSGTRFYTRELQSNIVNGVTFMNGTQMTAPGFTEGFPSPDYHLLSLQTTGPTWAAAFASERVGGGYGHRSGAQRLGEVLVYNAVSLTAAQNRGNDAYLSWKWFARLLPTYRAADQDLLVLRGSGTVSGASVLARELAPTSAGLTLTGSLVLDYYSEAASTGAVIRLETLPAPGVAAVSVSGDIALATTGTVVLGELRAGVYTVLEAGGALTGKDNLAGWKVDASAAPHAAGYQYKLTVEGEALVLRIAGRGMLIRVK